MLRKTTRNWVDLLIGYQAADDRRAQICSRKTESQRGNQISRNVFHCRPCDLLTCVSFCWIFQQKQHTARDELMKENLICDNKKWFQITLTDTAAQRYWESEENCIVCRSVSGWRVKECTTAVEAIQRPNNGDGARLTTAYNKCNGRVMRFPDYETILSGWCWCCWWWWRW